MAVHAQTVVELDGLSRRFAATLALDRVSLRMKPGLVYGLVGANGAGKTTLIKHLLGALRAKQGAVRVFGLDPVKHPVPVLARIGYLSEERDLPEWMRVSELMRYTRAFHPRWDQAYADELLTTFGLDGSKRVKTLSKGMRAQAGLIAAVSHRPDLLLLDEPSTGLDALVRRDILNALVRAVADDGRTALFSSHLLDEVEQMSDYLFMMDHGRLVLEGTVADIVERHFTFRVRFHESVSRLPACGALWAERCGELWRVVFCGELAQIEESIRGVNGEVAERRPATVQEIFVALAGRDRIQEP